MVILVTLVFSFDESSFFSSILLTNVTAILRLIWSIVSSSLLIISSRNGQATYSGIQIIKYYLLF